MSEIPLAILNCPGCGYDLRVMSTIAGEGRCPECGEVVNAEQWAATKLAWEHRQSLTLAGKVWVFFKTVVVAIRQPYRLAALAPYGAREGSARAVAVPCVAAAMAISAYAAYLFGNLLRFYQGFNFYQAAIRYVWAVGVDTVWVLVIAAPLWILIVTRASYEGVALGTRTSGAEARRRALSVAPFLIAGVILLAIGLLATVFVIKFFPFLLSINRARSDFQGTVEIISAAVILSIALTGVIVGLLTLLAGPVVVVRGLGGATRLRAFGVFVFLFAAVSLSAVLTLGAIPFSVGLYRLIRYSGLN